MDPEQKRLLEAMLAQQDKESKALMKELGLNENEMGEDDPEMAALHKEMLR